jgi:hypothetical protein
MRHLFSILAVMLLLSSCRGGPRPAGPGELAEILGPMTATGVVADTPLSLYRRGTHALTVGGRERMYLESRNVNLAEFVGKAVSIDGELQINTHPSFLPVLVVSRVNVLGEGGKEEKIQEEFSFPWGMLEFSYPSSWIARAGERGVVFLLEDAEGPFITVSFFEDEVLQGRGGVPLLVAGKEARRILDPVSLAHTVEVPLSSGVLRFAFAPQEGRGDLRDAFYALLQAVRIEEKLDADGEKEGNGPPCGGPAGVLCPKGSYCRIMDAELGIGRCVQL